jgi:predicted aspartyl protease
MGTVTTSSTIANPIDRARSVVLPLLVDTGSDLSWIAAETLETLGIAREKKNVTFVLTDGRHVARSVGFAIIRVDDHFTIDEIVFAEPGDLQLLGARTLDGLNLTIDRTHRHLVPAGPLFAATTATSPTPA